MSVFNKEIIAATTGAVTSNGFSTLGTITIMADALTNRAERVTLQQTRDGVTWIDVKLNGVVQALTRKHTQITVSGPGKFRVVKTVTATSVGVTLWRTESK